VRHGLALPRCRLAPLAPAAEQPRFDRFRTDRDNFARNEFSEWLESGFMAVVFTTLIALLDSLAYAAFSGVEQAKVMRKWW
jgi:hypothetical protein